MTDQPQPGDPDEPGKPDKRDEPEPQSSSGFPGMPFGGGGFDLAQLMQMLQSQGPINWDVARQVAAWVAVEGGTERPIDPAAHEQLEELARAAQTHVVAETDLGATFVAPLRTLGPQGWAALHLDALRPVLSTPWHRATRSDVLRCLMLSGLAAEEPRAAVTASKASAHPKPRKK